MSTTIQVIKPNFLCAQFFISLIIYRDLFQTMLLTDQSDFLHIFFSVKEKIWQIILLAMAWHRVVL